MSTDKNVNPLDNKVATLNEGGEGNIKSMAEVSLLSQDELVALKIIYPGMPQREILNAFRDLRTRLIQKSKGKNFVLLVTSLIPGCGTSFAAANIAASFALDEQKTALYIDCNFENSFANKLLKDTVDYGLIDFLENPNLKIKDIIYSTGIPRVRVIPPGSGGETSIEKMASSRMQDLISALLTRHPDRYVVLDVPPITGSSLPRILSGIVDMAVLVVPFGKVTPTQIMSGIDAVGEQKFSGLVFNFDQ